jgi:hypothetical protein
LKLGGVFDGASGDRSGEADKLKEVFYTHARMFGSLAGKLVDVPIQALFEMTAEGPADTDSAYRGRLVSVMQVGDTHWRRATGLLNQGGSR